MSDDTERRGRTTFIAAFLVVALLAFTPALRAQVPPCGDGTLDIGEECDEGPATGTAESCCAIDCTFRPASTPCRVAAGACDVDDVCSGTSGVCDDAKSTDVCRPAAGVCDLAESCDGASNDCPADDFASASVECRPAAGVCDVAEQCTGSAAACPADAKSTAVCRPSAGVCDLAESCDGVGDACPADDFASASVECRPAAGVCDVAEQCTGSAAACPVDAKSVAVCRPSAGVCDVAESCDGVGDACPADAFATAGVTCRSAAGVCDVAEQCTGSGAACPADAKSTAVCRPSAGVCDVAESCDGVGDACPADGFVSAGVECRAAAGICDVAEQCTGSSAACPADGFAPDETSCDDANSCSINDRCVAGVCGGFLQSCGNGTTENGCFEECDDGNTDPGDGCDPTCHLEPCGPEPIPGCRVATIPGKAGILVLSRLNPEKNKLQWKYSPGDTTPKSDFGNPLATTSYDLCLFEENAGDSRLAARYAIPAGGTCGSGPCWRESSSGFKYTDKAHASDGISSVVMKQGLAPGKTKIILSGKGANLPLPVLPLVQSPNVVMQLRGSNGICWETRFAAPAVRNQPDQFRDK